VEFQYAAYLFFHDGAGERGIEAFKVCEGRLVVAQWFQAESFAQGFGYRLSFFQQWTCIVESLAIRAKLASGILRSSKSVKIFFYDLYSLLFVPQVVLCVSVLERFPR